jgi:ribosome-binding ATPase YchF (GTP1/OBG family)
MPPKKRRAATSKKEAGTSGEVYETLLKDYKKVERKAKKQKSCMVTLENKDPGTSSSPADLSHQQPGSDEDNEDEDEDEVWEDVQVNTSAPMSDQGAIHKDCTCLVDNRT